MPLEIVITDVTLMKRGEVCVAGWCPALARMVRPLKAGGHFWVPADAGPHLFAFGNVVSLPDPLTASGRALPHAKEDAVLHGAPALVRVTPNFQLPALLAPSVSANVKTIFGQALINRRHIDVGTDCVSLGAIDTHAKSLGFKEIEKNGIKKLRCWFFDGVDGEKAYDFPVSSKLLRETWEVDGLEALEGLRKGKRRAHIRIGLAGELDDACYAMVNNIHFY